MEKILLLFTLLAISAALPITEMEQQKWEDFKKTHNRQYENEAEEQRRLEIFLSNLLHVNEHNKKFEAGLVSYTIGINHFSDQTEEELTNTYFIELDLSKMPENPQIYTPSSDFVAPDSFDWREKGAVTPVKNQGHCGSCWSFSSTGALEGQFFQKSGKLVSLSEQDLVDCSQNNHGCNGGLPWTAFTDVRDNGGIDTEDSYPYKAIQQKCSYDPNNSAGTDTGATMVNNSDENYLKAAVAQIGPISVAINGKCIQHYSGGIFDDPSCDGSALNHAVLVVGYGSKNDKDYWIVKNSWGSGYGEGGYIYMSRNKNNQCGINSCGSYPNV